MFGLEITEEKIKERQEKKESGNRGDKE